MNLITLQFHNKEIQKKYDQLHQKANISLLSITIIFGVLAQTLYFCFQLMKTEKASVIILMTNLGTVIVLSIVYFIIQAKPSIGLACCQVGGLYITISGILIYYSQNSVLLMITRFCREKNIRKNFLELYLMEQKNLEIWKYIMFEVFPGLTALLQKKPRSKRFRNNSSFALRKSSEQNYILNTQEQDNLNAFNNWKLIEVNKFAKETYNFKSEEDFTTFLTQIQIISDERILLPNHTLEQEISEFIEKYKRGTAKKAKMNEEKKLTMKGILNKLLINICPFTWNGEIQFLLRMENISQADELKALQEQDKYKDRLLANVSHDLRTPLNAINYLINQSKDQQNKQQRIADLDMALVNTDLLMNMINDILDYSQMKDNKLRLIMSQFSLRTLLESVYKLMKIQTELKGISFYVKNKSHNLWINSDLRRLKQILINLLSNAIKFTERGFIKLIVQASTFENRIRFTVEDTGSGIEQEVVNNLGKPFATFSTQTNQNKGGIGLGLNFCKQLIGLLGPDNYFNVQTQIGQGSKFSFVIYTDLENPAQNSSFKRVNESVFEDSKADMYRSAEVGSDDDYSEISQKEVYCAEYAAMSKIFSNQEQKEDDLAESVLNNFENQISILIVDDNVFNLLVLKNQLEKISVKFKIFKSNNGKQAVDTFVLMNEQKTASNLSLIVMDCEMPIMNGFEASKRITNKIKKEKYSMCIVIGYTSLIGQTEEKAAFEAGMSDILQKPASFNELKTKIFLNLNKLQQQ